MPKPVRKPKKCTCGHEQSWHKGGFCYELLFCLCEKFIPMQSVRKPKVRRCPHCGYTAEDKKKHFDHYLCKRPTRRVRR